MAALNALGNVFLGLVIGITGSILAWIIIQEYTKLGGNRRYMREMKANGLLRFLPFSKYTEEMKIFDNAIQNGKGDDEILIVGRTLRWLTNAKHSILDGLKKGMSFKLLILSPEGIKSNHINLAVLRLTKTKIILDDLGTAIGLFQEIVKEAKEAQYPGHFEVRTCEYAIPISTLAINSTSGMKMQLDFQFGDFGELDTEKRYVQYYESAENNPVPWVRELYAFYKGYYESAIVQYLRYSNGTIEYSEDLLSGIISEKTETILSTSSESEKIRTNEPRDYLDRVADVFEHIHRNKPAIYPVCVQIELTNQCNAKCKHCLRHKWPASTKDPMPLEMVNNILDEFGNTSPAPTVVFSGGEPTLHPEFGQIMEHGYQQGLRIGLLTDGYQIGDDDTQAIAEYASWVRISIDGYDDNSCRDVRGISHGLQEVKTFVEKLVDERGKCDNKCRIGLCYTIQSRNISGITAIINVVKKLPLPEKERALTFKFVHGRDGCLCNTKQLRRFLDDVIGKQRADWKTITNLGYLESFIEQCKIENIASGQPLRAYFQSNQAVRCFTPYMFAIIDASGGVYPCCFLYHDNDDYGAYQSRRNECKIDDLHYPGKTFTDIWKSSNYILFRNNVKRIDVAKCPECGECTRHYLHNVFMTRLHGIYWEYAENNDLGAAVFRQVMNKLGRSEDVWF